MCFSYKCNTSLSKGINNVIILSSIAKLSFLLLLTSSLVLY